MLVEKENGTQVKEICPVVNSDIHLMTGFGSPTSGCSSRRCIRFGVSIRCRQKKKVPDLAQQSNETLILFTSDSKSAAKKIEKLPMEKAISLAMFKKRYIIIATRNNAATKMLSLSNFEKMQDSHFHELVDSSRHAATA